MKLYFNKNYNGSGVILLDGKELIMIKELEVKITNTECQDVHETLNGIPETVIKRVHGKIKINEKNYNELSTKNLKEKPSIDTDKLVMDIVLDDNKGELKLKNITFRPTLILDQKLCKLKYMCLFSLDLTHKKHLEEGKVKEELKKTFEDKHISFDNAIISKMNKNWIIKDGDRIYLIKEEKEKLNIYKDINFDSLNYDTSACFV